MVKVGDRIRYTRQYVNRAGGVRGLGAAGVEDHATVLEVKARTVTICWDSTLERRAVLIQDIEVIS